MRWITRPLLLVVSLTAAPASAQTAWTAASTADGAASQDAYRTGRGDVSFGGEVVATMGAADDTAFFNYTDYERNALRTVRLALAGLWQPFAPLAFVAEVRSDDLAHVAAHALYVRVRPWRSRAFDIQAGRIPPSFGAYSRRAYDTQTPLIGHPLAYQYLTSLRPDALPATTDDLLRMRGRGWRSSFPVGSTAEGPGVPLVSALRWDTGVQAKWAASRFDVMGSVTAGTLSDPRVDDNNGGRQLTIRGAVRPLFGLVVGASAARGAWMADDVRPALPVQSRERSFAQRAFGVDAEYSRDHWIARGELVWTGWTLPIAVEGPDHEVGALGMWVEGRYRVTPRLFVAARGDRLAFSRVAGTLFDGRPISWDARVERLEAGVGWFFLRNLVGRVALQRNWRDGGRVSSRTFLAGGLVYWF
ncbi:MAG TPA: hypothetical protein VE379_09165 [Vicinamibacterales bacterium]|jgi:hypothetical protein|nr:hypothetical protein [Vicinamibacterales bacterium]